MAGVGVVRTVVEVLAEQAGADAPVATVEVAERDGELVVAVLTPSPGRFIGRRGSTAEAIRRILVERLGRTDVRFVLGEARDTPPLDPPAGVREPRRPRPESPAPGLGMTGRDVA